MPWHSLEVQNSFGAKPGPRSSEIKKQVPGRSRQESQAQEVLPMGETHGQYILNAIKKDRSGHLGWLSRLSDRF